MNFKKQTVCTLLAMSVLTLASCNKDVIYKVTVPETNGLIVTPLEVKKGEDYAAKLAVNKELTNVVLPTKIDKITSGNAEIVEDVYTYNLAADRLSADLLIPAKVITGDIDIRLELVEKLDYDAAKKWVSENYKETTIKSAEISIEFQGYANTEEGKETIRMMASELKIKLDDNLKGSIKVEGFLPPLNGENFEEEFQKESMGVTHNWEFTIEDKILNANTSTEDPSKGTVKLSETTNEKGYPTSKTEDLTSIFPSDTIRAVISSSYTY